MNTNKNTRFTSEIDNNLYNNANSLQKGSTFIYLTFKFTVTGFTKYSIQAENEQGVHQRFTPIEFENYVLRGFITDLSKKIIA